MKMMFNKSLLKYVVMAMIPLALNAIMRAILIPMNLIVGEYLWVLPLALFAIANPLIVAPLYLVFLSKYYVLKRNVNYALCCFVTIAFGIGNVFISYPERWNPKTNSGDFVAEIMFMTSLATTFTIILIGIVAILSIKRRDKKVRGQNSMEHDDLRRDYK